MSQIGPNWKSWVIVAAAAAGLAACSKQAPNPSQAAVQEPGQQVVAGFHAAPAEPNAKGLSQREGQPPMAEAPGQAPAPRTESTRQTAMVRPKAEVPAPPVVHTYTVPAGTSVMIRTTTTLTTKQQKSGDSFVATLEEPIVVDGVTVAPKGTGVSGTVVNADPGGRVKGRAMISLALTKLELPSGAISINTANVSHKAKSSVKKDALKVGIGAGIGAAIGAIAGGGKGAAIGSAAGGGAGAAATMATRGDPAVVPAETVLRFTLQDSFRVTLR